MGWKKKVRELPGGVRYLEALRYVCDLISLCPLRIAELGTWRGDGTKRLRYYFPRSQIYTIDTFRYQEHGDKIFKKTPTQSHWDRLYLKVQKRFVKDFGIKVIRCSTSEAAWLIPNELDIVFIDASHDYEDVKRDILEWRTKVRPGGILCGHDYTLTRRHFGVKRAIRELFKKNEIAAHGHSKMWFYRVKA